MSIYKKVVARSGLQKSAAFNISEFNKGYAGGVGSALGKTLVVGAAGLGALAAGAVFSRASNNIQYNKFQAALDRAIKGSQVLQQYPEQKVKNFANTLFKFAPNVVSDHNVLAQILSNTLMGDSIDPNTIKTITDMEGRMLQNSSIRAFR